MVIHGGGGAALLSNLNPDSESGFKLAVCQLQVESGHRHTLWQCHRDRRSESRVRPGLSLVRHEPESVPGGRRRWTKAWVSPATGMPDIKISDPTRMMMPLELNRRAWRVNPPAFFCS